VESFINALLLNYFKVFRKFANFNGRSDRKEFWMFFLVNVIINIALNILGLIPVLGKIFSAVSVIYSIAVLVPSLAVGIRRLHDSDKTGLLMLLLLIPIAGIFAVLGLCAMEGTPGENQYGQDPKTQT